MAALFLLVAVQKLLRRQSPEIPQRRAQPRMVPVPPRQRDHPLGQVGREPRAQLWLLRQPADGMRMGFGPTPSALSSSPPKAPRQLATDGRG